MQNQIQIYKNKTWLLFLLLGLIPVQVLFSLREKSPTFDETPHLFAGYSTLKTGDFRMMHEHPPLAQILAALPLLALNVRFPVEPTLWAQSDVFTMGWRFLFFENDAEKLFFWSRFPMIGLGILLGYFIYRWAQELYGQEAGLFALLFYTFCPNILAHVGLIHTDIPVATFMFLSCYFFARLLTQPSFRYFLQTAITFSLALLSKNSAVLLVPGFLLIGLIWVFINPPVRGDGEMASREAPPLNFHSRWKKVLVISLLLILMGVTGYVALWAGYGFRYEAMKDPVGEFILPWELVTPQTGVIREISLFLREYRLLPEAYIYGLLYTHLTSQKRQSFLAGAYSFEGWWYYFLVSFLIKTPLPFLILLGLATLSLITRELRRETESLQPAPGLKPYRSNSFDTKQLLVILPPILYFAFSLTAHINIGHRHVLPIYPFLFVWVSRLVSQEQERGKRKGERAKGKGESIFPFRLYFPFRLSSFLFILLVVWFILTSLGIYPDYLAYFNELIGGPDKGYKYLVDSNLDWGQDLKGLKKYMDRHGIEKINLAYFGTADPDYYGINHIQLPGFLNYKGPQLQGAIDFRYPIAISASLLQGVPFINHDPYKNFLEMKPIAKIGYSIFIYQITP